MNENRGWCRKLSLWNRINSLLSGLLTLMNSRDNYLHQVYLLSWIVLFLTFQLGMNSFVISSLGVFILVMPFASRDSFPCGHYCCFLLSPSPSILLFFPSPIFSSMLFSASYYGSRVRKWLGYWFSNSCNVMRKWNLILGSWMEFLFSFLYLKF